MDLTRLEDIPRVLDDVDASTVINCAAFTDVERAEEEEDLAMTVNGLAVEALSGWAIDRGCRLLTFSTDYVFDGSSSVPYTESSQVAPINAYGRSKLAGERAALSSGALIVRTSWLISGSHPNFVSRIIQAAREHPVSVVDDQIGCPTSAADLAAGSLQALTRGATGLLHLVDQGQASWFELARCALEIADMDPTLVSACSTDEYPTKARRPSYSVLHSERLDQLGLGRLPHWRESLRSIVDEICRDL